MQKASEASPSAMCSVVGCDDETLNKLITHVRSTTNGTLLVCIFLFIYQHMCSLCRLIYACFCACEYVGLHVRFESVWCVVGVGLVSDSDYYNICLCMVFLLILCYRLPTTWVPCTEL